MQFCLGFSSVLCHLVLEHGHRHVPQIDVVLARAGCGACSFCNQPAATVVVVQGAAIGGALLNPLTQRIDRVLHRANTGHRAGQAAAGVIGELVATVVGDTAVGVGGDANILRAADLGQFIAVGGIAERVAGAATDLAGTVAGGVIAISAAGGRSQRAGETVQPVVAQCGGDIVDVGQAGDVAGRIVAEDLGLAV